LKHPFHHRSNREALATLLSVFYGHAGRLDASSLFYLPRSGSIPETVLRQSFFDGHLGSQMGNPGQCDQSFEGGSKTKCGNAGIGSGISLYEDFCAVPNEEPDNIGLQALEPPLSGTSSG